MKALIALSLSTARRAEDEGDHVARQNLYLERLRQYPIAVALKALEAAAEQQFFPTWQELLFLLNRYNDAPPPAQQLAAPDARPDGQRHVTSESLSERMARLDPARGVLRLAAIGAPRYRDLMIGHRRLSDQGMLAEVRKLEGGGSTEVDASHAEKLAESVMRSELGQRALAEQWGRFLWDFVVDHGRAPRDREIDKLIREAKDFLLALADCERPTKPSIVDHKALASLGRTLLEREDRLAAEYWVAAAA